MEEGAGRSREEGEATLSTCSTQHTSGDSVGGKEADFAEEGGVVIRRLEGILRGKN